MSSVNPNLILIKAIVGTFINRTLPDADGRLPKLTKEILEIIKLPVETTGEGSEGQIAQALKFTLDYLQAKPVKDKVSLKELQTRVKINCSFAEDYIQVLESILEDFDPELKDENKERVAEIVGELSHERNMIRIGSTVSGYHRKINFDTANFDMIDMLRELKEQVEEISQSSSKMHEGFGGKVDFSDPDSIEKTLENAKESLSYDGVIRTGLHGLNKMWGVGGHVRGLSYLYGALTHNYKSGILLDYCRWIPMYNKPNLLDKTKKSMILRISFENKPEQDIIKIYKSIWEQEHQQKMELSEVNVGEAARYIKEKLCSTGYHFEILCFDPNNMDVWDLITILEGYEAEGYEIEGVIIDYLELISKKSDGKKRLDELITYNYEVLRNHCFPRGITQYHAHQCSTQAQEVLRECGSAGFAKKIAPGGFWMNCKSLTTKVDGAAILHIHEQDERKFLTVAWAKNRTSDDTSERAKNFAQEFMPYGGITDDVLGDKNTAIYSLAEVSNEANNNGINEDEAW